MASMEEGRDIAEAVPLIALEGSTLNMIPCEGPPVETRFIAPSEEMVSAQVKLGLSLVVSVGAIPSPSETWVISAREAGEALRPAKSLPVSSFAIRPYWPENFLVTCRDQETKGRMMEPRSLTCLDFVLTLSPWSRHSLANPRVLNYEICVDIIDIPAHAWETRTAETLVADFAYIKWVSPITIARIDMSCFRVCLCARTPNSIPQARWIEIPEHRDEDGNQPDSDCL